mmetsp:Transcript_2012/g.7792  ORF Transcript_2012/g.7792 Transcript_2012/m.7792 type:complete len:206 (-) Transcript_2012:526-1143(-)
MACASSPDQVGHHSCEASRVLRIDSFSFSFSKKLAACFVNSGGGGGADGGGSLFFPVFPPPDTDTDTGSGTHVGRTDAYTPPPKTFGPERIDDRLKAGGAFFSRFASHTNVTASSPSATTEPSAKQSAAPPGTRPRPVTSLVPLVPLSSSNSFVKSRQLQSIAGVLFLAFLASATFTMTSTSGGSSVVLLVWSLWVFGPSARHTD